MRRWPSGAPETTSARRSCEGGDGGVAGGAAAREAAERPPIHAAERHGLAVRQPGQRREAHRPETPRRPLHRSAEIRAFPPGTPFAAPQAQ